MGWFLQKIKRWREPLLLIHYSESTILHCVNLQIDPGVLWMCSMNKAWMDGKRRHGHGSGLRLPARIYRARGHRDRGLPVSHFKLESWKSSTKKELFNSNVVMPYSKNAHENQRYLLSWFKLHMIDLDESDLSSSHFEKPKALSKVGRYSWFFGQSRVK